MGRKCGYWSKQNTIESAVETVQSAHLIDLNQMQALFPDAKVIGERFMGLTRSLIAVKE
jgi:hypothetical protein